MVESILEIKKRKRGRGIRTEALVKWTGYQWPTWEPVNHVKETSAMEIFEAQRNKMVSDEI